MGDGVVFYCLDERACFEVGERRGILWCERGHFACLIREVLAGSNGLIGVNVRFKMDLYIQVNRNMEHGICKNLTWVLVKSLLA